MQKEEVKYKRRWEVDKKIKPDDYKQRKVKKQTEERAITVRSTTGEGYAFSERYF